MIKYKRLKHASIAKGGEVTLSALTFTTKLNLGLFIN